MVNHPSNKISNLRDAYDSISEHYQEKKSYSWQDLILCLPQLQSSHSGIMIDIGSGNGRNLIKTNRTLIVSFDLSIELLSRALNPEVERVAGALPNTPFRQNTADELLSVAVLHHLPNARSRLEALQEILRIGCPQCQLDFTVWRKWRPDNAKKIIHAIKKGKSISNLVDHYRPWKQSDGDVLATRFYHYFTRKELIQMLNELSVENYKIQTMGGKQKSDNFLVSIII